MRQILFIIFFFYSFLLQAQRPYPRAVAAVISRAGKNKGELEKSLNHFYKNGDTLKIKAIEFLVANMDIHYSADFYWADSNGKKIPFNEFDYPTFETSVDAFDSLKKKHPGIHPLATRYRDIDTIKSDYLIDNVDYAFEAWKSPWAKNLSFQQFCEYILPYRASIEPLENWRKTYHQKYAWINDSTKNKSVTQALQYFATDQRNWFINTFEINPRKEPLPRLGALQLLYRKRGPCEDIADLMVFALRSQGFMVSNDVVTYWATSTGSHFFNSTLNDSMQPIRFDVSSPAVRFTTFAREPAKVIRTTYSKQPNTLSSIESAANIPDCFMRTSNYLDVTNEYWETSDVSSRVFPTSAKPKVAYVAVFNGLKWRPTWWGKIKNDSVVFTNLCKGAVFLPMYFLNGKLVPAGYPVASGYTNTLVLKPDTNHIRSIHIKQQDKYLFFRPGKKYKLFYWNNTWKLLGEKTAEGDITELIFDKVPRNALFLLLPEYSQGKERPFMILDNDERIWW